MRYVDCKVGMRVKGTGGSLVQFTAGTIKGISGGSVGIIWDKKYPEMNTYSESLCYIEPLNPEDSPTCKPDRTVPQSWPKDTKVRNIKSGNSRYGWTGSVYALHEMEMYIIWDNGRDAYYDYSNVSEYLEVISFPKVLSKDEVEYEKVYSFFATYTAPGCCSKCTAPLPCKYHD